MVSQTASTCNHYMARCTKNGPKILQDKRGQKQRNAPGKVQKKAKPGAFWVLERMRTVANRCERIEKTGKLGGIRGTDLSRLPPRSGAGRSATGLTRPPRHAPQAGLRAHLAAKSYRTLTKKSGIAEAIPDFFGRGRRTRTLGTRFWSGCENNAPKTGEGRVLPGFRRKSKGGWC